MANILSPVLEIIASYMSTSCRAHFELQVFTEVHFWDDGNSYLDIAVQLVNKQREGWATANIEKRFTLVIIELKKETSNAYKLLPQLLMYGHKWNCPRVFLSDYDTTMAFHFQPKHVGKQGKQLKLGVAVCERLETPKSVYEYGPKMAIAFAAVEQLHALGMADSILNVKVETSTDKP
ncbi:hypothetical protein JCM8097_004830 [Rhodosporidiobolus ruineniae]